MKRSEMLDKLMDWCAEYLPDNYNWKARSEELLDIIEEAGMLPPFVDKWYGDYSRIYADCYKWEDEEETN